MIENDIVIVTNMTQEEDNYKEKPSSEHSWIEIYYKCKFGIYPSEKTKFSCRNIDCENYDKDKKLSELKGSHVVNEVGIEYMTSLCATCNNYHNTSSMYIEEDDLIPLIEIEYEDEFQNN